MNKKKCPKCGEENPAEAVMCWACYTPLSGAAAGAAPTGAAGAAPAVGEEGEKKKIAPWQMGVLGFAVLVGLFMGARAMMPSSPSVDDIEDTPTGSGSKSSASASPGPGGPPSPGAPPSPVQSAPGGNSVVTPEKAPFTIAVPPNPRLSVATMAIVPTDGTSSGPQAAALAAYTRRQYTRTSKTWDTLYIYVFTDTRSAGAFADYMKQRRGRELETSDFSHLANLWSSCPARYEYSSAQGKRVERVLYPSKSPNGWWYSR